MAHLFCELFYRARQARLTDDMTLAFPASMGELGEALGMAIATVHRTLQELRRTESADFRDGQLVIKNWTSLAEIGEFNPAYLHARDPLDLSS
jgi:hypothetical protein